MTPDPAASPQPPVAPASAEPAPAFGWTRYAERINGRFAMVGFVALLLLEWVTGQDFFSWLGLR
ncbi:MAG TPA: chlorophyll a/b-binding protein [Nodosilinea sp.]|nr:chlorophyll a/b-binding protein [Nodosilinea sp.]